MKTIPLTQCKVAMVDDEDYDYLMHWKWYAVKMKKTYYAARTSHFKNGKSLRILMHRVILGVIDPGLQGDHIDHNGLNNQRINLRACTKLQNQANMASLGGVSKFRGVYWSKQREKWYAQIKVNKKVKWLGYHDTQEDAARKYDRVIKKHFGEFAHQNFK